LLVVGIDQLRLDPTLLASGTGKAAVTDLAGGNFRISSFFDVFVDLTLDGTFGPPRMGSPAPPAR